MQYSLTMKEIDLPFGISNSSHGFYQDLHHHVDQFHQVNVNGNSSSSNHQVSLTNLDSFDVYECKPFVENNNVHVMDDFQYNGGGFGNLNLTNNNNRSTPLDIIVGNQEQYGLRKWSHIAQMLPGRIGKQCRERWHNHLRPDIKKDIWTEDEDKILIEAHVEIGNKWAEIAKRLPGRTENSIKNHWNATKRRQYSKRKCRSKYPKTSLLQEYIKSLNLDKNPLMDYRRKSVNPRGNANKTSSAASSKAPPPLSAAQPQPVGNNSQFSMSDRLVPSYDFNEVMPDFCFDENLFEGGCSIDSLLDDIPCAPIMDTSTINVVDVDYKCDDMQQEIVESMMEGDGIIKKEMDLVEMVTKVNKN
ncbi:hypothetical protein AHAS_Ahas20G0012800 [Arachis hypogaea]